MGVRHRCQTEAAAWARIQEGADFAPNWTYPQAQALQALAETDLVLFDGGNGGGKSWFLAHVITAALKGIPWAKALVGAKPWVALVGVTFPQIRDTTYRYIDRLLPQWMRHDQGADVEGVPQYIQTCNGSRLIFLTGKQDVDAHAGRRLNLWVADEHPVEAHVNEGFFRMPLDGGKELKMLIGMTPVHGKSWVYEKIVRRAGEIGARVITSSLWENGVAPCQTCGKTRDQWDAILDARGHERRTAEAEAACERCATYGVEPRVDRKFVARVRKRFRDDPRELRARLYGTWEDLDGQRCLTEAEAAVMLTAVQEPAQQRGGCAVFQEARPGRITVTGVDTSKGNEGDETVFQFLDANGEMVACWADRRTPPTLYTEELITLSLEYGRARACVESLDVGYFVIQELIRAGIPLYAERNPLRVEAWHNVGKMRARTEGLNPSPRTRDRILVQMVEACRRSIVWTCACHALGDCPDGKRSTEGQIVVGRGLVIRDRTTWEQVTKLRRNTERQNRIDVVSGEDDRAIALALANECRQSIGVWAEPDAEPEPLPPGVRLDQVLPRPGGTQRDALGVPLEQSSYLSSWMEEV